MGRLNGRTHACACKGGAIQTIGAPGGGGVFTAPAVWQHRGRTWAFVATFSGLAAYRLSGPKHPRLHEVWSTGDNGTSPVVAGGLLYVFDPGGGLSVYRPTTGRRVRELGTASGGHWNSPIVADGRIAVPTGDANDHASSGVITIFRKR